MIAMHVTIATIVIVIMADKTIAISAKYHLFVPFDFPFANFQVKN